MTNHEHWKGSHGVVGGGYGLGFLGALIYFLSTAGNFWLGLLGILKAIFWPAFLVYHLFAFLKV